MKGNEMFSYELKTREELNPLCSNSLIKDWSFKLELRLNSTRETLNDASDKVL